MTGRSLLNNNIKKIQILIDSETIDELLKSFDRTTIAILNYQKSDLLLFIRTPIEKVSEELKKINFYHFIKEANNNYIIRINNYGTFRFGYLMKDIIDIAKKIFKKTEINKEQLNKIISIFIQAVFSKKEKSNIYITNDKILLKNRLWFESHFPGQQLNIMTVGEASLFLDIFFKKNEEYFANYNLTLNKGYWYWISTRLKLPHYNTRDLILDALANRFCYTLMALDEIGIQYYSGVDRDILNNILYHFNYLITLITGIFDNLALKTNKLLKINFKDLRKVSLNNSSGREFLKEIKKRNPNIRNYINDNMQFIKLIYLFRELVIHQEGLKTDVFEYENDIKWEANFIKVDCKVKEKLKALKDKKSEYDPFTNWGFYSYHNFFYLDPYHFSLEATKKLKNFVDGYLILLGFSSFIKIQKSKNDKFTETLNIFENYHLGF